MEEWKEREESDKDKQKSEGKSHSQIIGLTGLPLLTHARRWK